MILVWDRGGPRFWDFDVGQLDAVTYPDRVPDGLGGGTETRVQLDAVVGIAGEPDDTFGCYCAVQAVEVARPEKIVSDATGCQLPVVNHAGGRGPGIALITSQGFVRRGGSPQGRLVNRPATRQEVRSRRA